MARLPVAGHHRPKPSCISARTTLAGNAALAYSTVRRGRPCLSVRGPRVAGPPSGGALEGRTSGGVTVFLGVPYATAPFGENRMRPPQSAAPWSGTRLATGYGPTVPKGDYPAQYQPLFPEVVIAGESA